MSDVHTAEVLPRIFIKSEIMKKSIVFLLTVVLIILTGCSSNNGNVIDGGTGMNYSVAENWAYFDLGEDRDVDVFLVCPTVDTRSETNSFDLNEKLKSNFIHALDMEKGIFEETGRLFSPYYRQMSINAYKLSETEREKAKEIAYSDISAAFRWYLDNENDGRGIILAGFSQGGEMCLELMKEYYGGDSAEAQALRKQLIAVYSIGCMVTEEMTETYPQIVPASSETDIGTVICYDCEDGTLSETIIIPAGKPITKYAMKLP